MFLLHPIYVHADDFDSGSDVEPTGPVTGYSFKAANSSPMPVSVESPPPIAENKVPIASAGIDQAVPAGALVVLSGSGSRDSDGSIVSYAWRKLSGPSIELLSSRTSHPSFSTGDTASTYIFQLTVRDDGGASAIDIVTIQVRPKPIVSVTPLPTPIIRITPTPIPEVSSPFSLFTVVVTSLLAVLLVLVIVVGRVMFPKPGA